MKKNVMLTLLAGAIGFNLTGTVRNSFNKSDFKKIYDETLPVLKRLDVDLYKYSSSKTYKDICEKQIGALSNDGLKQVWYLQLDDVRNALSPFLFEHLEMLYRNLETFNYCPETDNAKLLIQKTLDNAIKNLTTVVESLKSFNAASGKCSSVRTRVKRDIKEQFETSTSKFEILLQQLIDFKDTYNAQNQCLKKIMTN